MLLSTRVVEDVYALIQPILVFGNVNAMSQEFRFVIIEVSNIKARDARVRTVSEMRCFHTVASLIREEVESRRYVLKLDFVAPIEF
jgi:hypothetical protein